jgi:phage terminase large subunit-like protein
MVEGESGLLAIGPPQQRPQYEPTKRRLTWPNGAGSLIIPAEATPRTSGEEFFSEAVGDQKGGR